MQKRAGIVMMLGAILFIGAAFVPAIQAYWHTPLVLVPESHKAGWLFGYRLFAAGSMITAIGFAILGSHARRSSGHITVRLATYAADAFVIVGAICWIMSLNGNVFPPLKQIVVDTASWPWVSTFFNLTLLSFFIYGFVLIQVGFVRGLGWGTVGFGSMVALVTLYLGDLPPAVLYMLPLGLGIALVVRREPAPELLSSVATGH